ncbi:hypothetical protein H0H87_001637 [Tephrocybe sp. NHM501043]|nr:hypothetical protein H0H87_001637 [Tephrocybe sp. NHM501043]
MFPYPHIVAVASVIIALVWAFLPAKKWDPRSKHCYVTGGSAGLGLSLAILLTKKGADVSIVARNEERLQKALEQLESVRQSPNQILRAYSFPLNDAESSAAALEAASKGNDGKCPDAVFLCAGASRPGFFVEEDEASLRRGMDNGYWVQAWSALIGLAFWRRGVDASILAHRSEHKDYLVQRGFFMPKSSEASEDK